MIFNWSQTIRTAEKHLSRGKITAAIDEYRKLVNWDPTDLTVLNTLGDLYVRAGLAEDAKLIFCRVAQGYRHQGFTSKAAAILKKLIRIDPTDLDSAASLADCYVSQGLRGEAGRQYAAVADAYERAGREDKALDVYQRMAEIDPSNTTMLMMLGERWLRENLAQRAHASFRAAGDQFAKQCNNERALAAYLKAQAALPDDHKTLQAILELCEARGEAVNAVPILCDSLSRNSRDAELHRMLGSAYLSAGRLDDAESTFRMLLALDCNEYRNLLIVGERFLERGDLDRAAEQIDCFVDALIANRHEQPAVDLLSKVLDRDPGHPASLRRLALIFRKLREDFNLIPTLTALADGAMHRGDRDEAIKVLRELCSLEPYERAHREALQGLGIDAPAPPLAVCSVPEDSINHTGQSNILDSAISPGAETSDSMAFAKAAAATSNDPGYLELSLALQEIYSDEASLNVVADNRFTGTRITHTSWPLTEAPHEFIAVDDIRGTTRRSQHNGPSLTPSSAVTGFALLPAGNRRRSGRVPARVPLVVISDTGGWREFTETVDVSDEGLMLQLAHTIPPMTELRVLIETTKWPAGIVRIRAINATKGIVRYCGSRPGKPNLVGVEFRISPETHI